MINKPVYVVANRHQEQEVLQHLETKHRFWSCDVAKPTQKLPSQLEWRHESQNDSFPYIIIENEDRTIFWLEIMWLDIRRDHYNLIYDGRQANIENC